MMDFEVMRLRELRGSALRVRAIARRLSADAGRVDDPLLDAAALAAWRIARAVSGQLRAHPYLVYQRDVSLGVIVRNTLAAVVTALVARSRAQGLTAVASRLGRLGHALDDARALTLTPALSDTLGRFQVELRSLLLRLTRAADAEGASVAPKSPARVWAPLRRAHHRGV